jgi:hypothetical protein
VSPQGARRRNPADALWAAKWRLDDALASPGLDPWQKAALRVQLDDVREQLQALDDARLGPRVRRRGQGDHE